MDNETRLKYSQVDPETCDINDLKDEIKRLENMSAYYDTKQLAIKKFLNSIYGSCASKYFIGFNVDIAEAITLQGQDLNHFSENAVNYYFKNIFPNDEELHKKLGISTELAKQFDIDKGRITEQKPLIGKEFSFLKEPVSMVIAGDTDSLDPLSKIYLDKYNVSIADAFNQLKYENHDIVLKTENGNEIVPVKNHTTKTYDEYRPMQVSDKPINYIMRHKVTKSRFKIKTKNGKEIIVTGDHSIMIVRNGKLQSIKAKDIDIKTDKVVEIV